MIYEKSYGAVIFWQGKVLIEHMVQGHYTMPKGHIEKGETPKMTAIREVKEETNLDVEIDESFHYTYTYSPKPGVSKDATYFLGKPLSFSLRAQKEEVQDLEWVLIEEAAKLLTFSDDRIILQKAADYIKKA